MLLHLLLLTSKDKLTRTSALDDGNVVDSDVPQVIGAHHALEHDLRRSARTSYSSNRERIFHRAVIIFTVHGNCDICEYTVSMILK